MSYTVLFRKAHSHCHCFQRCSNCINFTANWIKDPIIFPSVHTSLSWEIEDVHRQSVKLTQLFISGVESVSADLKLVSPRDPSRRGSQVSFAHPRGYSIVQGLIENGVIGDFREPDTMRFGFAPLYNTERDVKVAVDRLAKVMASKPWENSRYRQRGVVT